MKNSTTIQGNQVLTGEAKRASKVFSSNQDAATWLEATNESKAFIKGKNRFGQLTKESKEAKATLCALLQLGAIGEANAVTGRALVRAYEQLIDSAKGAILNDANKVGRVLRSVNYKPTDAERVIENWATPTSVPQKNYFNLEFVYPKVRIGRVGNVSGRAAQLEAKYYLKSAVALDTLNVRSQVS